MKRIFTLSAAFLALACADADLTSPPAAEPSFTVGFSRDYLAGVVARLGAAEHIDESVETDNTFLMCVPETLIRLQTKWTVRTQWWQGYDAEAGISESLIRKHWVMERTYTNLETGVELKGRQAFETGAYAKLSDDLTIFQRESWQVGNVLSLVYEGEGRIDYKVGHQVISTDMSSGTPVTEIRFVGSQDLGGRCPFLVGETE
ncbi:MAG: hypothetical protein R3253_02185 [Longimicrobiales bacterium]|nr:hypothetical protein [Longimicrobiales bacterium]